MGCFGSSTENSVKNNGNPVNPYPDFLPQRLYDSLYHISENSVDFTEFRIDTRIASPCTLLPNPFFFNRYKKFPQFFKTAVLRYSIYICGGLLPENLGYTNQNFQIVTAAHAFSITERAQMKENKCNMGLAVVDEDLFIIAGGNNKEILATTEVYNANVNVWTEKGSLNIPRYSPGMTIFNGQYAYVIGGCTIEDGIEKPIKSIETCDLAIDNPQWHLVPIYISREWQGAIDIGAFQISNTEILICGGFIESNKDDAISGPSKNSYILDLDKYSIVKCQAELKRKDLFVSGFYYGEEDHAFAYGISGAVHSFNIRTRQWSILQPLTAERVDEEKAQTVIEQAKSEKAIEAQAS